MALQKATRTGGDYLDLRELTADGPVTIVFRIREFLPGERGDFGMQYNVMADALICTGPRAGEVHENERFLGAITNTLRGITAKQSEAGDRPSNGVGDEIVSRVETVQRGKQPAFIAGNVPSDAEFDAAGKVHADGKGWAGKQEPAMASAGTSTGGSKPWDD